MGVTKTDFVRGLQCEKMLWLDSHKPQEKIIPEDVRRRLDAGNAFGDVAMGISERIRKRRRIVRTVGWIMPRC